MSLHAGILAALSDALVAHADVAGTGVVAVHRHESRQISGFVWSADLVVTSEQTLPHADEFEIVRSSGAVSKAKVAGRDPGTNIAVLRLDQPIVATSYDVSSPKIGALAFAYGAAGQGRCTSRCGVVQQVGPEWSSSRGGQIDKNIVLDIRLARYEEGGPVFDAKGGLIGMSTLGPRGRVLAIPTETLRRVIPLLAQDGRIKRGWLGVKLQPIEVPNALQDAAGQSSALMAMSVADDSPAAAAGILAGDIILSVGGTRRLRRIASLLGPDSIGSVLDVQIIRAGKIQPVPLTITARPPE
jgi:S1-C subfamily serine protease